MDAQVHSETHNPAEALLQALAGPMARTNSLISDHMQSAVPVIPALAEHLIDAGGKRVRPLITLAAASLIGVADDHAARLAAAVEFIHTATLLHDDVVDHSSLRRGRTAAHLIWGAPSAVLVGDFLFSRAFELMVGTGSMPALAVLARAARVIAEGEVKQLSAVRNIDLSEADYMEIITAKTAVLFSAAAEAGAIAAGATHTQQAALATYGLHLGIAFQLADDALDYDGQDSDLGKHTGDDFREGKVTLPLALAMARTRDAHAAFWQRAIADGQGVEADFNIALDLIRTSGALADSWSRARDAADTAVHALAPFTDQPLYEPLAALARFCAQRRA